MTELKPPALWLTWAGVICFFTISGDFLDTHGWDYSIAGGPLVWKVHPGTYFILAAFAAYLAQANPVAMAIRTLFETPVATLFLLLVIGLTLYVVGRFGTSGSAFLLDLDVAPVLMGLLLCRFPERHARRLFPVTIGLLGLDAAIGIGEYATGSRIVAYVVDGKPVQEPFFRSTALLGHPLQNALAMTMGINAALAATRHRALAWLAALLMAAALIPFGGRSALVTTLALLLVGIPVAAARLLRGRRLSYAGIVGGALALVALVTTTVLLGSGFAGRTRVLSELRWDASANTRLLGLHILDTLSPFDAVFGIGPLELRRRTNLLGDYYGIIGLENSWLLLFLIFGAIGVALFTTGLFAWLWTMLRRAPAAAWLATLAYFAVASSNNTLATKDSTLVLLVAVLFGAMAVPPPGRNDVRLSA